MVLFEKEEGPNIGGQWIDQNWVPNFVLNVKKDQFTITKWAKDLVSYLILLFAFTYMIFTSSGYSEFVAYQRVWRRVLRPRAASITTPASALVAIERLVLDDLVAGKRPYVDKFSASGGVGVDVLLGSILVGKIRLRQIRVNGVPCTRVHQMLKDYGMVSSKECYPPYTKLNEAIMYEKKNKERQKIYEKQYPYFRNSIHISSTKMRCRPISPKLRGSMASIHQAGTSPHLTLTTPTPRWRICANSSGLTKRRAFSLWILRFTMTI